MARAAISNTGRAACEPLYDIDPQTGASVEVFYADRVLAKSFGRDSGWFWWSCQVGFLPGEPTGPFATSYAAYRDALDGGKRLFGEGLLSGQSSTQ
jgi:hypothetical protein